MRMMLECVGLGCSPIDFASPLYVSIMAPKRKPSSELLSARPAPFSRIPKLQESLQEEEKQIDKWTKYAVGAESYQRLQKCLRKINAHTETRDSISKKLKAKTNEKTMLLEAKIAAGLVAGPVAGPACLTTTAPVTGPVASPIAGTIYLTIAAPVAGLVAELPPAAHLQQHPAYGSQLVAATNHNLIWGMLRVIRDIIGNL